MDEDKDEKTLIHLKLDKSKSKTRFTKTKNNLLALLNNELINKPAIEETGVKLGNALDHVMESLERLCVHFTEHGDIDSANKTSQEIDKINTEYSESTQQVYDVLQTQKSTSSLSSIPPAETTIEKDMWRQMKRVGIPVFSGEKTKYETWKAAFEACIDKAPATPEYKLLQLRQYLKGDALQAIDDLGHSSEAYTAAKERLERKFGGEKRKLIRFLDDLDRFPNLKSEDAKTIEKFADLLDVAVMNLKQTDHGEELGKGSLYLKLQRKMPEKMLTRFNRWLFETGEDEGVETLKNWINQESVFLTTAMETKHGLKNNGEREKSSSNRAYFSENKTVCKVYQIGAHSVWECEAFKALNTNDRWKKVGMQEVNRLTG